MAVRRIMTGSKSIKDRLKGITPFVVVLLIMTVSAVSMFASDTAEAHKVSVHEELTVKALQTLYEDDKGYIPEWLDDMELQEYLREGARDADMNDASRNHYYNPYTEEGLSEFKSAKERYKEKVYDAREHLQLNEPKDAMMDLGWALHIIQDMTVPHHTHLTFEENHSHYEGWIADNLDIGHIIGGGNYSSDVNETDIGEWVHQTALEGYSYFKYVNSENGTEANYTHAWKNLHPIAIRQSAGFLHWFFNSYIGDKVHISVKTRAENSISVRWRTDYTENFSHYELYIAENETELEDMVENGNPRTNITVRELNSYTFSGLEDFSDYYIQVKVVRDGQEDTLSKVTETRTILSTTTTAIIILVVVILLTGMIYFRGNKMDVRRQRQERR